MPDKKSPRRASTSPEKRRKRQRLGRGEREQVIITEATKFFADQGFRASTRDLARAMGVTQALLYRYFPSKRLLIEKVFESRMANWDPALTEILSTPDRTLDDRLVRFYQGFAKRFSRAGIRLFLRAELDDQGYADQYTFPLNERILAPVVAALRREAGLPDFDTLPMLRGERELVMTLHGAIAHMGFRKHLYDSPLPDNLGAHVKFYVRAFLSGALENMRRIHDGEVPATFRTKLGPGGGRPKE
ncbi:MAG: TetR/AcrR family transcriptional regulator [Proteobacteria bacterium]|nr:TetR/AcrR family transcriptional regulator [Pseudomonadota bacterium]